METEEERQQREGEQKGQGSRFDPGKRLKKKAKDKGRKIAIRIVRRILIRAATSSPIAWIIAGIIVFIIIFMLFFAGGGSPGGLGGLGGLFQPGKFNPNLPIAESLPGITIKVVASPHPQVNLGDNITYTISVTYNSSTATYPKDEIIIYDILPPNTKFVSTISPCTLINRTPNDFVECPLASEPDTTNFYIVLQAIKDNTTIINTIKARSLTGAILGAQASNESGCSDSLVSKEPCDFSKEALYSLLKQQDPQNADFWFYKIIPCESGYNPKIHRSTSVSNIHTNGLFQLSIRDAENEQDTVLWQIQTANAISYNKNSLGGSFDYWQCSK